MPRTAASNNPPISPMAGSSPREGSSVVNARAPTSDDIATLAPNDEDVNGASSDRYQSIDTLEMIKAWKARPSAASNRPDLPPTRGTSSASADHPSSAMIVRTTNNGMFK